MASDIDTARRRLKNTVPADDFADRLEASLQFADRERQKYLRRRRVRRVLPLCLLVGPIVGWRLMLASPSGVHVYIDSLAWLAFILDVGVHVDSAVLSYLGLQALPSVVGFLLFVLLTATLLSRGGEAPK